MKQFEVVEEQDVFFARSLNVEVTSERDSREECVANF